MITPPVPKASAMLEDAIRLAYARGLRFTRLAPKSKRPVAVGWASAAAAPLEEVLQWAAADGCVGMRCGPVSGGIVVIDVDGEIPPGLDLPATPTVQTPRGHHFYYHTDKPVGNRVNMRRDLAPTKIDRRGTGGQVVFAGSRTGGGEYRWVRSIAEIDFAPLPFWCYDKPPAPPPPPPPGPSLKPQNGRYAAKAISDECAAVACAVPGERNARLNTAAFNLGQLVSAGEIDSGEAEAALLGAAHSCGLGEAEARATIASGFRGGAGKPRKPKAPPIRTVEPFQPFPVDALPEAVAGFVSDSAEALGCDASFVALPLLVGLASAIGNSRRVQLKRGWLEPAILWGAIIGESGSTKSPALELALRAMRERQRKAMREYAEALAAYVKEYLKYKRKLTAWKRSKLVGDPPEPPQAPTCERFWTDDVTIEALAKLLQDNPRGLLVIRDELAGWLHFDRYSANGKGGEAAKWLEMFGGRALVVDRKTSGTIYVPQAAVSIVGGIQPGILARYVGQEHRDNGLLARLLLTMPPRRPKVWTDWDIDPRSEAGIAGIFDALHDLEPATNTDGEPRPAIVHLTADGKQAWIAFYDAHNVEAADLCGDLAAAWAKLEGYAARFALVHHLVRRAAGENVGDEIDAVSIAAGVKLSRWFAHEARRVYAVLGETEEDRARRQLIEWIERRGGAVTVRELTHSFGHYRGQTSEAKADLDALAEAGFGAWEYLAPGPKGGRPSARFVLAIADTKTQTPAGAGATPGFGIGDTPSGSARAEDADGKGPAGDGEDWGEV